MKNIKKEYVCSPGKNSKVVIEDVRDKIKEGATLVLGFAGVGLIGPIIGNTLIEQIDDLKEIGFVASDMLPPISTFYDGKLKHPFRLYYSPKYNLILGISEVPFQISSAYNDLAKTICNWALSEDVKAKEIIVFQGIAQKGMIEDFPVYYASEDAQIKQFEDDGVEKVEKGIIVGPEATIINEALTNKLKPLALFTPVYQIPTPEGAASIIEVLNKRYNLDIDTSPLLEEGKEIKEKMLELAKKAQQYQKKQLSESKEGGYTQYYQ
ncbi:MAG: proteasome assembly chaperone family protein [Promethearchaeota archaeon]|nr:MAG: proteasome assembly chaperone family protein [Candidatus Lokiarchaeota archaeon]